MPARRARRLTSLALCLPLVGCGPAAPTPSPAAAEAKGRCEVTPPERNRYEALDPLNAGTPGDRIDPEFGPTRGFYALGRQPAWPREGEGHPVELRLRAPSIVAPGEPLGIELSFVNRSRGKVTLLQPLLANEEHERQPFYDLYVRREGSPHVYEFGLGPIFCVCDLIPPPVRPADYIDLLPGQAAKPDVASELHFDEARLRSPGRYVLWAVYRFCDFGPWGIADTPDGSPDTHWFSVVRGVFASNPVSIEVR